MCACRFARRRLHDYTETMTNNTARTITLPELTRQAIATAPERFEALLAKDPAKATRVLAAVMAETIERLNLEVVA